MHTIRRIILLSAITFFLFCNAIIAQKQWSTVGTPGFTPSAIYFQSYALDQNGYPWIAYQDVLHDLKLTVMRFDGNSWATVGSPGFSPGIVEHTSMVIDNSGNPYVAFRDHANKMTLTVMKYNGSSWTVVGTPGLSVLVVAAISMALDNNGVPNVAYWDNNDFETHVKKFNGSSWVPVGSGFYGGGEVSVLKFDKTNTPHVAFFGGAKITVAKYNSGAWSMLGGYYFAIGIVSKSFFALDNNGVPHVAFTNVSGNGITTDLSVKKFNGSTWADLGSTGIPTGSMNHYVPLAFHGNGTPYIAYIDAANSEKAVVTKYNGSSWVTVGNTGFSAGGVSNLGLMLDQDNIPNLAYIDSANLNRATVMKYDCPVPTINICAVSTDTVNGKNIVVWNGNGNRNVDSYKIYREDNGNYVYAGSVAGKVNSFTDWFANPAIQSYRYKLAALDSCGVETDLNTASMHKTMKLSFSHMAGGIIYISWNRYEGLSNILYTIKRSNNGGPFTTVTSFFITGNDTMFTDVSPPSGSNRYRVDIVLANPCLSGSATYDKVTSNIVTAWNTGIRSVADGRNLLLMPNPVTNVLNIHASDGITNIDIFDLTGQKLITARGENKRDEVIDVSGLPHGVYLLMVNRIHNITFIKQ